MIWYELFLTWWLNLGLGPRPTTMQSQHKYHQQQHVIHLPSGIVVRLLSWPVTLINTPTQPVHIVSHSASHCAFGDSSIDLLSVMLDFHNQRTQTPVLLRHYHVTGMDPYAHLEPLLRRPLGSGPRVAVGAVHHSPC